MVSSVELLNAHFSILSHPSTIVAVASSWQLLNALSPTLFKPGVMTTFLIPLSVKQLCFNFVRLSGSYIDLSFSQP